MNTVSMQLYLKVIDEAKKLRQQNTILQRQVTILKRDQQVSEEERIENFPQNILFTKTTENAQVNYQQVDSEQRPDNIPQIQTSTETTTESSPLFLGPIFYDILKRHEQFRQTNKKLKYSELELQFWVVVRYRAPKLYKAMVKQFGAPAKDYIRKVRRDIRNLDLNQSKQYDTELAKSLGFQCYCEQTYKYKSRFLIGEMLILKRIYIENQDATIPQICELFRKETQMAISAYTAKRILEGLNVGKNHVINKYLLDKGLDVDFKW
ncbi:Hypothetical_protein [Hexamita inflata]|uniref:Hypothetical_protein n=1 Tax=Hexamita inflata TaxID=28002 RepID=A0AA86USN5_9EUKA|nr:Hypothetical protein HINF_LOCUS36048 [Hexamita inflata]